MMKLLIIIITVFLISTKINAQNVYNTERQDSTNVYYKALAEFCYYIEDHFHAVKEITVESSPITTMFPEKIRNLKIEYLPRSEVKKEFKKKGYMYYCVITPLLLRSGEFIINVIPFRVDFQKNLWTEYKKNEIGYVTDGGITSRFRYDCANGNLIYIGSEGGFKEIR